MDISEEDKRRTEKRRRAIQWLEDKFELTPREVEATNLCSIGLSNKEIAHLMQLSVDGVKGHLHRVYAKLGVKNRSQLVITVLGVCQDLGGGSQ